MTDLEIKRNPSLVSAIFDKLESLILAGILKPGEPINERALSLQFAVSRAPVREACRRLEQAGLVEIFDNRGAYVREVSRQSAVEICELRHLLSREAALKAPERATKADIKKLSTLVSKIEAAAAGFNLDRYYEHNDKFHSELVKLGGNTRLAELYRSLNNELSLYRQRAFRSSPDLSRSLAAHREILDALAEGDGPRYRSALDAHGKAATQRLLEIGMSDS